MIVTLMGFVLIIYPEILLYDYALSFGLIGILYGIVFIIIGAYEFKEFKRRDNNDMVVLNTSIGCFILAFMMVGMAMIITPEEFEKARPYMQIIGGLIVIGGAWHMNKARKMKETK